LSGANCVTRRRQGSTIATIVAMIAASVVMHALLWPLGDQLMELNWGAPPVPIAGGVMEVSLMPVDAEPEDPEDRDQAADELDPTDPPHKLVNLDRLADERAPEETDVVSEFDNRVDKQTRAPNTRKVDGESMVQPGDRPDGSRGTVDQAKAAPPNPNSSAQPLAMGRQALSDHGDGTQSDKAAPSDLGDDGVARQDPGRAGGLSPRGIRGMPDMLRRQFGSPGSIDDLDGLEDGSENLLNSKRWKYASFFNRVRNAVAEHWHPEVVHAANDPDGRIYGTKTRRTKLIISLNPDGSLHRIRLETSSDVDYLDEEAIRAVRAAQPFSNPPPGLVDATTGRIEFAFGFIFEIHGGRRIFRYQR
jgi:TonB family protein